MGLDDPLPSMKKRRWSMPWLDRMVATDTARRWPFLEDVTADFLYLRLHGDEELYASGYTESALRRWASRIALWSRGEQPADAARASATEPGRRRARDVYCYFDNDAKVRAPFDAKRLREILGLPARRWSDAEATKEPEPAATSRERRR